MSTSRNQKVSFEIDVNKASNMKFKSLDFLSARGNNTNSMSQMSTLQQSAIRSINKYYQSSNIKDILGYEEDLLSKHINNKEKIDYHSEVCDNMMSLKRSYDVLRNKYLKLEKEIVKMRNELDIMKQTENTLSKGVYGNEDEVQIMQMDCDRYQQQLLETECNKKTYNHMIDRMRRDIQVFKLQSNERKEMLGQSTAILNQANTKLTQITVKEAKAQIALDEVRKFKQAIDNEREGNLSRFQYDMEIQVSLEKQRDERIKRQQEIAEIAQTDMRDINIKKWRKLQLVNEFLSCFLKRKMEKEMTSYEDIEKSFQRIKAATGISEAGEIVHKFLNRESTYSRLLISIEEYEQKIDNLKKSNDQLKEKYQTLKAEQPQDRVENKQTILELDELLTKYQNFSNKAENARMVEQKIYNWGINYLAKIERVLGVSSENVRFYQQKYSKSDTPKLMQEILKYINENLVQVDSEQIERTITDQYRKVTNLDLDNDFKRRNNRIKDTFSEQSHKGSHEHFSKAEFTDADTNNDEEFAITYDPRDTQTTK